MNTKLVIFVRRLIVSTDPADKLYNLKIIIWNVRFRMLIYHLIEDIQYMCKVVGSDNKIYDI